MKEREKWQHRLSMLKSELENEETRECTFKPQLVGKKK
jgi:hypothetical protein